MRRGRRVPLGRRLPEGRLRARLPPGSRRSRGATIAVASEAAFNGFDEIQFDYLPFPTDGRPNAARYARPNTHNVNADQRDTDRDRSGRIGAVRPGVGHM